MMEHEFNQAAVRNPFIQADYRFVLAAACVVANREGAKIVTCLAA